MRLQLVQAPTPEQGFQIARLDVVLRGDFKAIVLAMRCAESAYFENGLEGSEIAVDGGL